MHRLSRSLEPVHSTSSAAARLHLAIRSRAALQQLHTFRRRTLLGVTREQLFTEVDRASQRMPAKMT